MLPKNRIFSRWWGPVIGLAAGFFGALRGTEFARNKSLHEQMFIVALGTCFGFLAGCLVLLLDPPLKKSEAVDEPVFTVGSTLIGRIMAILGLILFFIPPLGFAVSLGALVAGWRQGGWPRVVSWIGVGLSSALLLLLFIIIASVPHHTAR